MIVYKCARMLRSKFFPLCWLSKDHYCWGESQGRSCISASVCKAMFSHLPSQSAPSRGALQSGPGRTATGPPSSLSNKRTQSNNIVIKYELRRTLNWDVSTWLQSVSAANKWRYVVYSLNLLDWWVIHSLQCKQNFDLAHIVFVWTNECLQRQ